MLDPFILLGQRVLLGCNNHNLWSHRLLYVPYWFLRFSSFIHSHLLFLILTHVNFYCVIFMDNITKSQKLNINKKIVKIKYISRWDLNGKWNQWRWKKVASGSVSSPKEKASEPKGYIIWYTPKVHQIEWDLFPDPSKILNLVPYRPVRIGID